MSPHLNFDNFRNNNESDGFITKTDDYNVSSVGTGMFDDTFVGVRIVLIYYF